MNTKKTFQKENDELLQYILDTRIFNILKNPLDQAFLHLNATNVELYITSECNLKCEYCYLSKHGDELYPKEIRNQDLILQNLQILLKHFFEEKYIIQKLELFSGEIWGTSFSDNIFNIILNSIKEGLSIKEIIIPSNMTFITSENATKNIQEWIDKYKTIQTDLVFSASIDGLYIEDLSRPFIDSSKNGLRDEDYYEKLFSFCKKNNFGFHPMISSSNAKYQINNHEWFLKMMKKYEIDYSSSIMFLEVRNNDWTQETIKDYLKFLDYFFDTLRTRYYKSDKEMIEDIFNLNDNRLLVNYNPISLNYNFNELGCTIHKTLHIRLGDLAIVPCHRLSYSALNYGYYIIENNKIIGIKSNNPQMALKTYFTNMNVSHNGCDTCIYRRFCLKGCLGAQYETNKDLWMPCENVCELLKNKIRFLIKKYEEVGFLKILESDYPDNDTIKQYLKDMQKIKEYN